MIFTFTEETAPKIKNLKRMASTKANANLRLEAVVELGNLKANNQLTSFGD